MTETATIKELVDGQPVPSGTQITTPPRIDVGGFAVVPVHNEIMIMCTRAMVGSIENAEGYAIQSAPVAQLAMSIQSLKDLYLVIGDRIADYEKEWGEIATPYMRKREGKDEK